MDVFFTTECATKTGMIIIFGEISSTSINDYQTIVRKTVERIGYDDSKKGKFSVATANCAYVYTRSTQ